MAQPTTPIQKIEMPGFEKMGETQKTGFIQSLPNQGIEPARFEGVGMPADLPPLGFSKDNEASFSPAPPPSVDSTLLNKQINDYDVTAKKTDDIEKQLKKTVMPTIQKLAQTVNDLGTSTSSKKTSLTEERPTIPPSNLIFLDRLTKVSEIPHWA